MYGSKFKPCEILAFTNYVYECFCIFFLGNEVSSFHSFPHDQSVWWQGTQTGINEAEVNMATLPAVPLWCAALCHT